MVEPGTQVSDGRGDSLTFLKTSAETGGELLEMLAVYQQNPDRPPLHYHPQQEEQFQVLSGALHVQIGEEEAEYKAGESFTVPAGTQHGMHNRGEQECRVRWQVRPAMRTEDYLVLFWGGNPKIGPNTSGLRRILQFAVILNAYRPEIRLSRPSPGVQAVLLPALAALGKLLGYRARLEEMG